MIHSPNKTCPGKKLQSNMKGWARIIKTLVDTFGSDDGWEYMGTSHVVLRTCTIAEHQMVHQSAAPTPLPGVTIPLAKFTRYPAGSFAHTSVPTAFFYLDQVYSDWDLVSDSCDPGSPGTPGPIGPIAPVDDYQCKRCGNPKCSKTEKSCWKCGEPIPKVA